MRISDWSSDVCSSDLLVEAVFGVEQAQMEAVISQYGLKQELATLAKRDRLLALAPLSGRDPDEALTDVPYVKGAWVLSFLERRFGRERFDTFLRGYFEDRKSTRLNSSH